MAEIYEIPQGRIIIIFSDKKLSIGLLELKAGKELPRHNRPIKEELLQVYGSCVMRLFDGEKITKEVTLKENEKLSIKANQFHIHSNPTKNKSTTLWLFEGDITEVTQGIRTNFRKIS